MGDAPAAAAAPSPSGKRRRGGEDGLRRVAEIVMVLAAAGEVRGGREPTAAERALAAEARERLAAAVTEGAVRPKDLFPGEAVRAVVEDLGLNRAKDPASMGFRPPKASIADRLMLTKRKMEEVKEAPAQPISSPQTIVSSGMSEFHGLHGASKFGAGAARNPPTATTQLNSASLVTLKPPGSSPAKPVTNSSAGALPHTGAAHLKLEKDSNGPLNLTCSGATIVHSAKSTPDTFARPNVNAVQSSNQLVKDTKPVVIQGASATGNPVTGHRAAGGVAHVPLKPAFAHHNDIARAVQQVLHQPTNHPAWTPPSNEYMHSRLCCQICKVVISDAESLLVCDACERGAHLVCLQNYGNKGVPKAEWHCSVCLTQSKGKPLPPKYGKVTRTAVASKAPPVNGVQFSLQGSAETMVTKENNQKKAANGNPTKSISTQAGSTVHNSNVLALSATTAGSQSQLVSTLRPSVRNAVKSEASSNEKEGNGQSCSSTENNMNSPNKRMRSDCSLNSADSANDTVDGKKTKEISGVKCEDNSSAFGATNIKLEAHEPILSREEEMVDHIEKQMEQTKTVTTEERSRTQATFELEKSKSSEMTGTSTDKDTTSTTEEKNHGQATSEPHTISDVEMTDPTGSSICQSSNVAIDEKLKTNATSEPHSTKDTEMSANNAPPIDQSNNLANEEKPAEQTSALNDVEFTNYAGIPTNQSQHANGINGNGTKEPLYGDKNKPAYNAASDHVSIQSVVPNGALHAKDEMLFVRENETMGVGTEAKEQAK